LLHSLNNQEKQSNSVLGKRTFEQVSGNISVVDIQQDKQAKVSLISQVNEARPHNLNTESIADSVPETKVMENSKNINPVPFPRRRSNKNMTYEQ
jgi:hypothetical protein